jgi:hypothetical protein
MYPEVRYPEDMSGGQGGWVLHGYERHGDALVSEHTLTGVDTDTLARFIRKHFDRFFGGYVIEDVKKRFSISAVYGNSRLFGRGFFAYVTRGMGDPVKTMEKKRTFAVQSLRMFQRRNASRSTRDPEVFAWRIRRAVGSG